ncbi:MAG: plastocyanin/azurin family copper-binding protein [Nitrososphaerales archaeon]
MVKIKAIFTILMLFASITALTGNVVAEEGKVVNVDIVYGAANVENKLFYNPATVRIEKGTTISWMNIDKDPHTVTNGTPDSKWGQVFDSGLMRQGAEYKFTFTESGTYPYLCALHPWMYGTIVVESGVKTSGVTIAQKLNVFIKSEKQSYSEGEIVRFTVDVLGAGNRPADPDTIDAQFGAVNGEQLQQVNVNRLDAGKYVFSTAELKPASYTLSVKVSKDGFEPGYSMLTVHVLEKEKPADEVPEPAALTISMETEQLRYNAGDSITISGTVSKAILNKSLVLQVFDSNDKLYTRGQVQLETDGTFEWTFKVADTVSAGTWTVKTKYVDQIATVSFEIIKPHLPVSTTEPAKPEPKLSVLPMKFKNEKITIARSAITDQTNAQLSNVSAGQLVVIQSVLRNNQETQETFAYVVQIKDNHGIVVKLESIEGVIPSGKSFTVGVSWIPEVTGTYSAETFVWRSLNEPVPLSLNLLKTSLSVT